MVTTSKSTGTTNDKIGYKWHKAGAGGGEGLVKRQHEEDDTSERKDGDTMIKTSKSVGTTGDKVGYSWRPAGLGE